MIGLSFSGGIQAQEREFPEINQDRAVELALKNYPLLKNEKRKIEREKALKKSAWDLGRTTVFTSGEELDNNKGIYTIIGFQQQQIDLLGIPTKSRLHKERIALASTSFELSELEVSREVKKAWSRAFSAKRKLMLYEHLDSLYNRLNKAVSLRYETEAISRLEMLVSKNRIQEIEIEKDQAGYDYKVAIQQLNLWLGDQNYTVTGAEDYSIPVETGILPENVAAHPLLKKSEKQSEVASAKLKAEKANFLPDFNIQYGIQEVNGADGFYNYQAGISIPLLSGKQHAEVKSAKIEEEIAREEFSFRKEQFSAEYQKALQNYKKWKSSWEFYRNEVVPLLEEQRKGTLLAFNEGAIDYTEMIQNLDNAVQSELKSIDAYKNYQFALAEIEFYLNRK